MKQARQLPLKECYRLLQVKKGATLEEVKRAYRQRAFELHPDLNPNTPNASASFQQLNEAYVVLSHLLQAEEEAAQAKARAYEAATKAKEYAREQAREQAREAAQRKAHEKATQKQEANRQSARDAYEQEKARAAAAKAAEDVRAAEERRVNAEKAQREAEAKAAAQAENASQSENSKEDVLRDLLNDPFARRVFEDIYSEIHRQERDGKDTVDPGASPEAPKPKKIQMEWGNSKVNLDFSHGIAGLVKGWLRNQIDESQSFKFPATRLNPGARLRLQIRRGLSGELTTVEITLPADFVIGRPVRLKGLGKRVGPWQGDLYLTFEPR